MTSNPPSAATDGNISTYFYTQNKKGSFVAVDLEDSHEVGSISLVVDRSLRKSKIYL